MELDPRSMTIATVTACALMGSVAIAFSTTPGTTPLVRNWGVAMLITALGLLGIALRGRIPDFASIVVANLLVVGALVLAIRSLRRFLGLPARDAYALVMVVLTCLLLVLFTEVRSSLTGRAVTMACAMTIISISGALLLRRSEQRAEQRSYRFTEFVFWGIALVTVLRVSGILISQPGDLFQPHVLNAAGFLLYAAFAMLATSGVMWIEFDTLRGELVRSARTDPLTGLLNRGAFEREFDREISRSARDARPVSTAIFDLDHFKRVNDEHGHAAGDEVLRRFSALLLSTVRTHDVVARYGGEEFVLLMPGTGRGEATRVAERIRERLEAEAMTFRMRSLKVTVSGGIATFDADGRDHDALLRAADAALYAAKRAGRNRIVASNAAQARGDADPAERRRAAGSVPGTGTDPESAGR